MKYGRWLALVMLTAKPFAFGATENAEPPSKEMLRMLEFLREMEMIKQLEMLKELQDVDAGSSAKSANAKPASMQKKGNVK